MTLAILVYLVGALLLVWRSWRDVRMLDARVTWDSLTHYSCTTARATRSSYASALWTRVASDQTARESWY